MKSQGFINAPQFTKTYLIQHVTGTGVMEDQFWFREIVSEHDTEEEADRAALQLKYDNNTAEEILSTWYQNSYWVKINTCTEEGKTLEEKHDQEMKNHFSKLDKSKYDEIHYEDFTFYVQKTDIPITTPPEKESKESYSGIWLDTSAPIK